MSDRGAAPGGRLAALRLALRLSRRETLRRPGRTLLAALLIALPVAGMVVAAVWVRTSEQTPLEQWRATQGLADVYATPGAGRGAPVDSGGPTLEELLPPGSRMITYRSEYNRLLRTSAGDRSSAEVTDLPAADPLAAPIIQVTSGRLPERSNQVFLTRKVAQELHAGVGDVVRLERPAGVTWTVVGVGERSAWWDSATVVLGPGTEFPWRDDFSGNGSQSVLVDLPAGVTPAQVAEIARFPEGVAIAPGLLPDGVPGSMYGDTPSDQGGAVAWSWVIGAVVLTVVGIVVAAAFAAGARRQLTMLGQLSANGASPATLRRVLFLQGTWTGALGTALGIAIGVAVLVAASPHLDRMLGRDVDGYRVRFGDIVPIVVLGVTAATLAALVPARTTARVPVLAALAGRRPLRPVPPSLTMAGVAVGGAGLGLLGLAVVGANSGEGGTVWALTAIVGGVAILLGACAVAPGYVSVLEPLAHRLRGCFRLAARSLARQRTRTGAVVSAVCATSALAIGASALVLSADAKSAQERDWMRSDEVHISAYATGPYGEEARAPMQTRPVEVPREYMDHLQRAIRGSKVHRINRVSAPDAGSGARWEVQRFVPERPLPDDQPPHLHLMSGPVAHFAAIAEAKLLRLYDLPIGVSRALEREGVVALGYLDAGGVASVSLIGDVYDESSVGQPSAVVELLPPFEVTVVAVPDFPVGSIPRVLVTPERAKALGLVPTTDLIVMRAPRPLSDADRAAIQDISEEHRDAMLDTQEPGGELVSLNSDVMYPSTTLSPRLLEALLTLAALVLSLFVVAVSLALAAAETRDERDVLVIVGAPPPTMRRTSGRKALLLSLLGAALAVPVGFLPVSVFAMASDADLPLIFPWRVVLLLIVAVPLVAAVVTTTFSGIALRVRPVRASTMAFD